MLTRMFGAIGLGLLIYVLSYAPMAGIHLDRLEASKGYDGSAFVRGIFESPISDHCIRGYQPVEWLHEKIFLRPVVGAPLRAYADFWGVRNHIDMHCFFRVQKRLGTRAGAPNQTPADVETPH